MKMFFQQFGSFFPRSVRSLVVFLLTAYLAAFVGKYLGIVDSYSWLTLRSPSFWKGCVWQIITYVLLPTGLPEFIINLVILTLLAARLETVWTARQLWSFCLVAGIGAGLGKALLLPNSLTPLMGLNGVIFGLLVACVRLRGSVAALLTGLRSMSVGQMLLISAALGFLFNVLRQPGERLDHLPLLCGGIAGWLYPLRCWRSNLIKQDLPTTSARIGRLEL